MAIYNVELRKRTGTTYDDKILVATHKTLVEGLLDGTGKILESLLPDSVFGGMRFIGVGEDHPNFDTTEDWKVSADSYVSTNGGTTRGTYFIWAGQGLTITVSTGHTVRDPRDHVSPYLNLSGGDTFYLGQGDWMICINDDGTDWAIIDHTNELATTSKDGLMSASDKTKLNSIATGANNYSLPIATSVLLGGIKVGSGLTIAAGTGVLSADSQTDNNFTTTLKNKLDGIEAGANAYIHPAHTAVSLVNSGKQTIGEISIDAEGHVIWVQGRNIDTASSSTSGLVELATNAESQTGTDNTRAVTPAGLGHVLGYALGFPIFADLAAANSAATAGTYKDGSYAFVEV